VAGRPPDDPRVRRQLTEHLVPRERRRATRALIESGIVSVAVLVGYFVLPFSSTFTTATVLMLVVGLGAVAVLLVWHLRSIIRSPYPRVRAVAALATTVPLFLVLFSTTYYVMSETRTDNFSEPLTRLDSFYFVVTVFATVGFGDITAKSEVARAVTTAQMLGDVALVGLVAQVIVGAVRTGLRRQGAESAASSEEDLS
jgi:voltage-gated potassium channel